MPMPCHANAMCRNWISKGRNYCRSSAWSRSSWSFDSTLSWQSAWILFITSTESIHIKRMKSARAILNANHSFFLSDVVRSITTFGALFQLLMECSRKFSWQRILAHFSYLPLANIFEWYTHSAVVKGRQIEFVSEGIETQQSGMQILRPTLLVAVPCVMNRLFDLVNERLANSALLRIMFWDLRYVKQFCIEKGPANVLV
jgi:hypothetical protein